MNTIGKVVITGLATVLFSGPAVGVIITVTNAVAPLPIDDNFASLKPGYLDRTTPIVGGQIGSNFIGVTQNRVFIDNGPGNSWWRDEVALPLDPLSTPLTITSTPTDALGHQNISVFDFSTLGIGVTVGGVTNADPDISLSTGQGGAFAMAFDVDREVFGFDIIGRDLPSSELLLYFFGRDGGPLSAPVVFPLSSLNPIWSPTLHIPLPGTGSVTISADEAVIAGVLLTSNDPFGVGYANLRVPVPGTRYLMLFALAGFLGQRFIRVVRCSH